MLSLSDLEVRAKYKTQEIIIINLWARSLETVGDSKTMGRVGGRGGWVGWVVGGGGGGVTEKGRQKERECMFS
jgi:hypothetical protein